MIGAGGGGGGRGRISCIRFHGREWYEYLYQVQYSYDSDTWGAGLASLLLGMREFSFFEGGGFGLY